MTITEVQLDSDEARRDRLFGSINKIVDDVSALDVFPSLVWVWCWDMIRNWYDNEKWEDVHDSQYADECFTPGLQLKTIWDKFWDESDDTGFSLEFGVEQLDESLRDWLRDSGFIVTLEDDSWLDGPIDNQPASNV